LRNLESLRARPAGELIRAKLLVEMSPGPAAPIIAFTTAEGTFSWQRRHHVSARRFLPRRAPPEQNQSNYKGDQTVGMPVVGIERVTDAS